MSNNTPHNPEAENAVLGSLLVDGSCIHGLRQFLRTADFFGEDTQAIYDACLALSERGEAIDQITVARELNSRGKLIETGGASRLSNLIVNTPTSVHAADYGHIVKNTAVARRAISYGAHAMIVGETESDPLAIVAELEKGLLALRKDVAQPQLISPLDLAKQGLERYTQLRDGRPLALFTGIKALDHRTGGLYPCESWLIGARPGVGKTTLVTSIAEHIAKKSNVLFCSLEMRWGEVLDRLIASRLETHVRHIRAGNYDEKTYDAIVYKLGEIAEMGIYFFGAGGNVEGGITTSAIHAMASHVKMSYGLGAVVIDYIGRLADSYGNSTYDRISYISTRIKDMAMSLEVPVLCVSQLSRALEQQSDKRPRLADLRESGRLEEDADVVLFLYRDDYYDDEAENKGKAELLIAKQRQGESNRKVELSWDAARRCYVG